MNEISLLALGATFSLAGALFNGIVFFYVRSVREDFKELLRRIEAVDVKANENRESIARLEGRFGRLGTQQNWRE